MARTLSRRHIQPLFYLAVLWPFVALALLSAGVLSPVERLLRGWLLPNHPFLLLLVTGTLAVGWPLGPSIAFWRIFSLLRRATLPPLEEARIQIAKYGERLERGGAPPYGTGLAEPIDELDKAFLVVIRNGGIGDDLMSAMRVGFCSLADWDPSITGGDAKLSEYARRDRLFGEWIGEAGNVREQNRKLRVAFASLLRPTENPIPPKDGAPDV